MTKFYVVRGIGFNDTGVWLSRDFEVTMLREDGCMDGSWFSCLDWDGALLIENYDDFTEATGIKLKPGEYTTIQVTQAT